MKHITLYTILLLLTAFLFSGCSAMRHLDKEEKLYLGADVKLVTNEKLSKKQASALIKSAKSAIRPDPNKKFLGVRTKLMLYTMAGTNPQSKFRKWLQRKGEAPVLLSSIKTSVTASYIDAKLFNLGVFRTSTDVSIVKKKHTAKVVYTCHVHRPYILKSINYAIQHDSISRLVNLNRDKSILKIGDDYNLDKLKYERTRIDAMLKEHGYFYFNPDYLVFKADTAQGNQSVALRLILKDSVPKTMLEVYRIHHVYVTQDYVLDAKGTSNKNDTVRFHNMIFQGQNSDLKIRPKVLEYSIYLKKDDVYSVTNHTITLNRLMSMGSFKFVSIKFSPADTAAENYLNVAILLTPMPKYTLRTELDLIEKSNLNLGPRLNLSFLNRNTFNGAELLTVNLAGSFEAQLGGGSKNMFSFSVNPEAELSFPRFIAPFRIRTKSIYIPKTRILLTYNYLKKVNYFDMHTFQIMYGYKWREDLRKEHEFNPIQVSFTAIKNKSPLFNELLATNLFLKRSYEELFVAGGNYIFTYNKPEKFEQRIRFYFQSINEVAGNVFWVISRLSGKQATAEHPASMLGNVYAQFAKVSLDGRAYYNFKNKDNIAIRLFMGVARSFGNTQLLPYSKQFFCGGPKSLRGFHINSLGPGTYQQDANTNGFLQLGGDVKVEMNLEYRFTIYKYIKGALFTDAGNVWLLKSNPSNAGSFFVFNRFLKEMAVDAGIGLRIDVSFFVLRFDLAIPLRKPWLDQDRRWVFDKIMFMNNGWRRDNLILNVAIGYPF